MAGVDKNDQFMIYYSPSRRYLKWTTKLAIHLFSLCVTNVCILHTLFENKDEKLDHEEYILKIVHHLIDEALDENKCIKYSTRNN